jgi:hypothetical protein
MLTGLRHIGARSSDRGTIRSGAVVGPNGIAAALDARSCGRRGHGGDPAHGRGGGLRSRRPG